MGRVIAALAAIWLTGCATSVTSSGLQSQWGDTISCSGPAEITDDGETWTATTMEGGECVWTGQVSESFAGLVSRAIRAAVLAFFPVPSFGGDDAGPLLDGDADLPPID